MPASRSLTDIIARAKGFHRGAAKAVRFVIFTMPELMAELVAPTENEPDTLSAMGTDAALWADNFRKVALRLGYDDMDDGWLLGWFANAIEAGRNASRGPHDKYQAEISRLWHENQTLKKRVDDLQDRLSDARHCAEVADSYAALAYEQRDSCQDAFRDLYAAAAKTSTSYFADKRGYGAPGRTDGSMMDLSHQVFIGRERYQRLTGVGFNPHLRGDGIWIGVEEPSQA